MSAGKKYLRCACPACGHVITYPDYSAGGTSVCAKCSKQVKLPAAPATPTPTAPQPKQPIRTKEPVAAAPKPKPSPPRKPAPPKAPAPPPKPVTRTPQYVTTAKRRGPMRFVLWTFNLAILAAVAIVLMNRQKDDQETANNKPNQPQAPQQPVPTPQMEVNVQPPPPVITPPPASPQPPATQPKPSTPPIQTPLVSPPPQPAMTNRPAMTTPPAMATPATNAPAPPMATNMAPAAPAPSPAAPTTTSSPTPPLSTNSLVVTGLAIERPRGAKGSKLTYVTGLMQNEAATKRFGVRVDLYLLDRAGRSLGLATDYTPVIEPNGSWRFRALVLDQRAVSARVKEIKENQ